MASRSGRPRSLGGVPAKAAVVALISVIVVVLSAPLALAACRLTDLTCVTNSLLPSGGTAASLPTEQVTDPVGGVVDGAVDAVDPVVDKAKDTVDGVLGSGGGSDPGPLPSIGPPIPAGDPGTSTDPGSKRGPGSPTHRATAPTVPVAPVGAGTTSVPVPARPAGDVTIGPGLLHRLGGALGDAAQQLRFPLALLVVVIAFLMLQNRLDRKDPKLALAPILPDVVRFE